MSGTIEQLEEAREVFALVVVEVTTHLAELGKLARSLGRRSVAISGTSSQQDHINIAKQYAAKLSHYSAAAKTFNLRLKGANQGLREGAVYLKSSPKADDTDKLIRYRQFLGTLRDSQEDLGGLIDELENLKAQTEGFRKEMRHLVGTIPSIDGPLNNFVHSYGRLIKGLTQWKLIAKEIIDEQ